MDNFRACPHPGLALHQSAPKPPAWAHTHVGGNHPGAVLNQALTNLTASEFEELVTVPEVVNVIQRVEMVIRIKMEIKRFINELGSEGRLISMQMEELVSNMEEEAWLLYKDYAKEDNDEAIREIILGLKRSSDDELLEMSHITKLLGYPASAAMSEDLVSPRGYRVLNKIPRLPNVIIHNLVECFRQLPGVLMATIDELDEVDGIGEVRARTIKEGLKRLQEQAFIDRQI